MKLDRNINSDGRGKYALINLRQTKSLDQFEQVFDAMNVLNRAGLLHWGNESPESQFFVVKYGDPFASDALFAYAMAVKAHAERGMSDNRMMPAEFDSWMEWHREILAEAEAAKLVNHKLPT